MAPVGYFYAGEQFAEQPAPGSQLEDQAGDGVLRPPPSVAAARNRAVAVAVAFVVGLSGSPALGQVPPTPAAAGMGQSFLHIHAPTAVSLAVSGDALVEQPPPSAIEVEYDGLVRPIVPTVSVQPAVSADPVLAIEAPSLPTGADETGFQPPVPPMPGPVVPTFTDTPERVVPPDPIFKDVQFTQTIVHDPTAIHLQQSGDVLPTGEAPSAPPAPIYDAQPLTDPTVVFPTPTVIFWIDQVLPGAVAPSQIEHYPDPLPLTNPVVVETVTPIVFTDQEILPGAVAPPLFKQDDDHSALTDPVVQRTFDPRVFTYDETLPGAVAPTQIGQADDPLALARPVVPATTDPRVFTADETLPQEPVTPLGIHDEAGPAELHMFSVAPVVDTRVLGEDVVFPPEVFYVPVFPPNIVTVTRHWRTDSDRTWRTDG